MNGPAFSSGRLASMVLNKLNWMMGGAQSRPVDGKPISTMTTNVSTSSLLDTQESSD
jgi:hypothetical protein